MLTNTAFSHSNEEYSPYFLVITHQTQASDDIDGVMQERRNSIANALGHVFIAPSNPYKECHLWVPPPLLFPSMQWNQYDSALGFLFSFLNSIIGQCTVHIAPHYIVPRHIESTILRLSNLWYPATSTTPNTYIWSLKSSWRCPVTQRCSLDMSLILCYSSMPSSDYLTMVGMDKYATLKM